MSFAKGGIALLLLVAFAGLSAGAKKSHLIKLDEDNWDSMLQGEWMVEFFAPWCPACKSLAPIWKDFADWSLELGISIAQVDVTTSPELSGRFMVTALPTIYHIKDGAFRLYRGSRDKDEFMTFIEEKKWQGVEEVSAWKTPSSFQMAVIAKLFKLSMKLRTVHSVITEDYGFPAWASYILYAAVTIVVGALLGLILVLIIDYVFPPASPPINIPSGTRSDEEDLIDDAEDDDADDDDAEDDDQEEKKEEEEKKSASEAGETSEPEGRASDSGSPTVRKRRTRKAD